VRSSQTGAAPEEKRLFTDIPFAPDFGEFSELVRLPAAADCCRQARELFAAAAPRLRPKALYRVCRVTKREENQVWLGGVRFESRLLSDLLAEDETVFPYLATCGDEADFSASPDDPLAGYWLDTLKQMALTAALEHLRAQVEQAHGTAYLASLNPGSGEAGLWPLEQQAKLFSLFAGVEARIGVQLTSSFLMVPSKSLSGLLFPGAEGFEICRLCSRRGCPRRRAPAEETVS
jgi:hypothetical protein